MISFLQYSRKMTYVNKKGFILYQFLHFKEEINIDVICWLKIFE